MTKIRTFTGKLFNPLEPNENLICIEDIAHSLSSKCRFTGHSVLPISIAEHCLRVESLADPEHKLLALLHDSTEAYLPDVASPLKPECLFRCDDGIKSFHQVEDALFDKIWNKLGVGYKDRGSLVLPRIKKWDEQTYEWEESNFMRPHCPKEKADFLAKYWYYYEEGEFIMAMSQHEAERKYLERYMELIAIARKR